MEIVTEDFLKVLFALFVGGLIGLERETRDKDAGFRTIILISTGAALFTIMSEKLGVEIEHSRIAANIVSGVGFLGAGVIFRGGGRMRGLTTAATIWLAAALGMGSGAGEYSLVTGVVILAFAVLWVFPYVERIIQLFRDHHEYEVVIPIDEELYKSINTKFDESKLKIRFRTRIKKDKKFICRWNTRGMEKHHETILDFLLHEDRVIEFDY